MIYFHRVLINIVILLTLLCVDSLANASTLIENDMDICGSIRVGSLEGVKEALKEKHSTTLEKGFLKIRCDDTDLIGMVVNAPTDRYSISMLLLKHFKRTIKKPELFSRAIIHEIDGKNILIRIKLLLITVRDSETLRDTDVEKRLVFMQGKYIEYLQQFPIAGSADVVEKHLKYLPAN